LNGNRRKKIVFGTLTIVFSIILVMSLIYIIWYLITTNHGRQEYSKLQRQVVETSSVTLPTQESVGESKTASPAANAKINFKNLQKKNADIYAWIEISGTKINYPVLQNAKDDTYYLDHNIDGSVGYPACIYSQMANAKDFSDFNTVLYGHNMKDGTMFHDLHLFENEEFFATYKNIYIYLPDKTLTYTIFAAYTFDDRNIMRSYDFSNESVRDQYLEEIKSVKDLAAHYRDDVQVTSTSNILTLSTCIGSQPEKRYLVQGVLTDEKG